jgi:hypothetical protein
MIQNLLPLFPRRIAGMDLLVIVGVLLIGLALWLTGARFNRQLLALTATVSGGALAFQFPRWYGWSLDPWSAAVLGALVLGVLAFVACRYVTALALGSALAVWAALTCIACAGLGHGWTLPSAAADPTSVLGLISGIQNSMPHQLATLMLSAAGIAFVAGTTMGFFWRRLGVVLLWSMTGLLLVLVCSLALVQAGGRTYVRAIPPQGQRQALVIAALLAIGAAAQWKITFAKRSPKPLPKPVAQT